MSSQLPSKHWLLAFIPIFVAFTAIAWSGRLSGNNYNQFQVRDTLPPPDAQEKNKQPAKKAPVSKAFEKEIKELDEANRNLDVEVLREIDNKKIQKEIDASITEANVELDKEVIDPAVIEKDVEAALKEVNVEKIQQEIREEVDASNNIDYQKIQREIQQSLDQVQQWLNSEAFRESIRSAGRKDFRHIKMELDRAKADLDKNSINIHIDREAAHAGIDNAKKELKGYQDMISGMEQDGLLNSQEDFTIAFTNGQLYVNGKKQTESLAKKYAKYFKQDGTTITRKNGSFTITIE